MRYLLDTNILIDYSKGLDLVVRQVKAWVEGVDEVGISVVQIGEFFSGVRVADVRMWTVFLASFPRWPVTDVTARRAGAYRYAFARRGIQIGMTDALIAAVAREHSATLITSNVRHFPMTDIEVKTI